MQSIKHDPPKIAYSIKEACQATSLGRTKIYLMLADPSCPLKAVRIGGRTVIPAEALHALISGDKSNRPQAEAGRPRDE